MDTQPTEDGHHHVKHPILEWLQHFFKWWLAFTGLIASTSVCPFCGAPGCPVGIGAATTMGGFFAFFMGNWKEWIRRLFNAAKHLPGSTWKFLKKLKVSF